MIVGGFSRGNPPAHWHSIDTVNSGQPTPHTTMAAAAWPSADLAIYQPLIVRATSIVKQLWFGSGNVGTGNWDIGLFDATGTALLRKGSTAKTTAVAEIVWDCTDTLVSPGLYYIGLSCSNATDTFTASSATAPFFTAMGALTEAAALPLPATATFALLHTLGLIPLVGMFLDTRVT